ncbi:MAG: glutathione S-transferase family protein [Pseudolabrys sp.]|nr:glutathione S-transferase family protein [Pseudolabrys sp.]
MITLSAFRSVPPFAKGLVRDLRVRWALEETGQPYQTLRIGQDDKDTPAYRAMQPFGQVPAIDDDGFTMFESAAIVMRIAEQSDVLAPSDAAGRSRMIAWMFAAMNTIEPPIQNLTTIDLFDPNEDWAKQRRPQALAMAQMRLQSLAAWLNDRDYLEDRFTAADLLMTTVLRIPRQCDLVASIPVLEAYRLRCEARPAFKRALDAQMGDFEDMAA